MGRKSEEVERVFEETRQLNWRSVVLDISEVEAGLNWSKSKVGMGDEFDIFGDTHEICVSLYEFDEYEMELSKREDVMFSYANKGLDLERDTTECDTDEDEMFEGEIDKEDS